VIFAAAQRWCHNTAFSFRPNIALSSNIGYILDEKLNIGREFDYADI